MLTEKQRMERFKASYHKSSYYPELGPLDREAASHEVLERERSRIDPQPEGERTQPAIRVSVIRTNKRNRPETETSRLFRFYHINRL